MDDDYKNHNNDVNMKG